MSVLCHENVHSQKTHCSQVSLVHILSNNVQSLKNTDLKSFFQNFHEKLSAVKTILGQKTSILSKLHYILDEKNQDAHFFFLLIFHEKITALAPILC